MSQGYHELPDVFTGKAPDHQKNASKKKLNISDAEIIPLVVDDDDDVIVVYKGIKSRNPIEEMKTIRETRYSDRHAFIREAFQNAARSAPVIRGANVKVTITENTMEIEDDAGGVTAKQSADPNQGTIDNVFNLGETGWSDELKQEQNPFGQGFLSSIIIFNKITVRSNDVKAIFDWGKIEKEYTENNGIYDLSHAYTAEEAKSMSKFGKNKFHVLLENPTEYWDPTVAIDAAREQGSTFGFKTLIVNNEDVEMRRFNEVPPGHVKIYKEIIINGEPKIAIEGYIAPGQLGDNPSTFYFGAPVRQYDDGKILIGSINVLMPRYGEPIENRAMWQESTKSSGMHLTTNIIEAEARKIALEFVKYGSDEQIKRYADFIKEYVDYREYKNQIRFKLIGHGMVKQIGESIRVDNPTISEYEFKREMENKLASQQTLMDAAQESELSEEESAEEYNEKQRELEKQRREIQEKQEEADEVEDKLLDAEDKALNEQKKDLEKQKQKNKTNDERRQELIEKNDGIGTRLTDVGKVTFWVKSDEISAFEEHIKKAEYYGFNIAIAHNALQEEIFEDEYNTQFIRIGNFNLVTSKKVTLKSSGPKNAEERRIQWVINTFLEASKYKDIKIHIASFDMEQFITVPGTKVKERSPIEAAAYAQGSNIYIGREIKYGQSEDGAISGYYGIKVLKHYLKYNDFPVDNKTLGWGDFALFLKILPLLSHELAHAYYHTEDNTQQHLEAMTTIVAEFNSIIADHQARTEIKKADVMKTKNRKHLDIDKDNVVAATYWKGSELEIEQIEAKIETKHKVGDIVVTPTGNYTNVKDITEKGQYIVYENGERKEYSGNELKKSPVTPGKLYHTPDANLVFITGFEDNHPEGLTYIDKDIFAKHMYSSDVEYINIEGFTEFTRKEQSAFIEDITKKALLIRFKKQDKDPYDDDYGYTISEVYNTLKYYLPVGRDIVDYLMNKLWKEGKIQRLDWKYDNQFLYSFVERQPES